MWPAQRKARRGWTWHKQARYFLGDLCFWLEDLFMNWGQRLNEMDFEPTPEEVAIAVVRGQKIVSNLLERHRLKRDHPCPSCAGRGVVELVGEDHIDYMICGTCNDTGIDPAWKEPAP